MNPDRTMSEEGRFIHAMCDYNDLGHKYDHPPAFQPRHRSLARLIIWWSERCPGVDILLSKIDVDAAFKRV